MYPVSSFSMICLANLIAACHFFLIIYMLTVPFIGSWFLLPGHIGFSFLLMGHWLTNDNTCAWTVIESKLRGIEMSESFVYSIVKPVFESGRFSFSDKENEKKLTAKLIWSITILVCVISCYRLYKNDEFWKVKNDPSRLKTLLKRNKS